MKVTFFYLFFTTAHVLPITSRTEAAIVTSVARELCSDGILNWGRLVSLVAFGVALLRLPKARTPDRARDIGVSIAAYLTSNHMDWFTNNGGWVRMVSSVLYCLCLLSY